MAAAKDSSSPAKAGGPRRSERGGPGGGKGGSSGLGEPWLEPLGEDSEHTRLCLMVRDEATGHIIGLGGNRIRQIASDLWPNVSQLSVASRDKGQRSRQPRQLSIAGTRGGLLSALAQLNELLPEADAIPQSAFALAETIEE